MADKLLGIQKALILNPTVRQGMGGEIYKQQVRIFHFVFHITMFYVRLGMIWWCMPLVPVLGDRSRQILSSRSALYTAKTTEKLVLKNKQKLW